MVQWRRDSRIRWSDRRRNVDDASRMHRPKIRFGPFGKGRLNRTFLSSFGFKSPIEGGTKPERSGSEGRPFPGTGPSEERSRTTASKISINGEKISIRSTPSMCLGSDRSKKGWWDDRTTTETGHHTNHSTWRCSARTSSEDGSDPYESPWTIGEAQRDRG